MPRNIFSDLLYRLRALFRRKVVETELDEELRFHFEREVEKNARRGMSRGEARRQARLAFGGLDQVKEECREARGVGFVETVMQDLRYAVRQLAKSPGFTVVAVLSLALGIGANTAIFSVINAFMLRTLPVRDPHRLVAVSTVNASGFPSGMSYATFEEIRRHQKVFSSLFVWAGDIIFTAEADGAMWLAVVAMVGGDFHSNLGVAPLLGRGITAEDGGSEGQAPADVAVISYGCWQRRFGGDPEVIGKEIYSDGNPYTIVGVTGKEFFGLTVGFSPDITLPMGPVLRNGSLRGREPQHGLDLIGRLRPGVTVEQARAHLQTLWPGVREATIPPTWNAERKRDFLERGLQVGPAATGARQSMMLRRFSEPLFILMGVAGIVLLIACANLANLLLARTASRHREMSVRMAIGATNRRITRQLLTESVLLATFGAVAGLFPAWFASRFLVDSMWTGLAPLDVNLAPDLYVFGFTTMVTMVTGVLFGLAPAWRAAREDPGRALQSSSRSVTGSVGRISKFLVSGQVALSLVAVACAGLLVGSLQKLQSLDLGYESEHTIVMRLSPQPGVEMPKDRGLYYSGLVERLVQSPEILSAGLSDLKPVTPLDYVQPVSPAFASDPGMEAVPANYNRVSSGFFEMLGIPLVRGRDFDQRDNDLSPRVGIVSRSLARRLFPSRGAIGQRIRVGEREENQDVTIVGVVNDAFLGDPRKRSASAVYLAHSQQPSPYSVLLVRTRGEPTAMMQTVRDQVEEFGHQYPIFTSTLAGLGEEALLQERVLAMLAVFFGLLALVLAAIGLYGVMSYTVTRRGRDIGIRMALGAESGRIVRQTLRESLTLVLVGTLVGIPLALSAGRLIASLLFEISPSDPATITLSATVLVAVACLATYLPARRASRIDPLTALRHE